MSRKITTTLVAITCFSSFISPTISGEGISNAFANTYQARAGVYFRLPFAGGLKKTEETQLNYGFAMGLGRTQAGSSMMNARRTFNADIIKLNFKTKGFKNFNVGGQDLYRINRTRLGATEGESMFTSKTMLYAAAGVGVVVLGVVLLKKKDLACGAQEENPYFYEHNGGCVIVD